MALFIRVYQSTSQKQVQLPLFKAVLRREKKKPKPPEIFSEAISAWAQNWDAVQLMAESSQQGGADFWVRWTFRFSPNAFNRFVMDK